jgi:hypothetical protein
MIVKDSKNIDELVQGTTSIEPQVVALKATNEKESLSKEIPIHEFELNGEEMTLIIKSFWQIQRT